jgi:hypothetical protein
MFGWGVLFLTKIWLALTVRDRVIQANPSLSLREEVGQLFNENQKPRGV